MSKTKKQNANAWQFQRAITNQFLSYEFPLKDWPRVENLFRYNLHDESKMKIKALEILSRFGLTACTFLWWLLGSDSFLHQRNHSLPSTLLPLLSLEVGRVPYLCFALAFLFNFSFQWAAPVKQGSKCWLKFFPNCDVLDLSLSFQILWYIS